MVSEMHPCNPLHCIPAATSMSLQLWSWMLFCCLCTNCISSKVFFLLFFFPLSPSIFFYCICYQYFSFSLPPPAFSNSSAYFSFCSARTAPVMVCGSLCCISLLFGKESGLDKVQELCVCGGFFLFYWVRNLWLRVWWRRCVLAKGGLCWWETEVYSGYSNLPSFCLTGDVDLTAKNICLASKGKTKRALKYLYFCVPGSKS